MITLALDYPPSTNRLWRTVRGRMITTPQVREWKQATAWKVNALGVTIIQNPVRVRVILHPKLTKAGQASQHRLDIDNAIKVALDALNGLCWRDDKQIHVLESRIGDPMPNGGLTVMIEEYHHVAVANLQLTTVGSDYQ